MDEFALIQRFFAASPSPGTGVELGIGDDCALLRVPPDKTLAVTTDTLIGGRHFPLETPACDIGWKALAVNLSDLAAMAAEPRWFTLALSLPEPDEAWLAAFTQGLHTLAKAHRIALVGGDTTRGALSITLTALGCIDPHRALRRSGAEPGDAICVTGTLGDAALALQRLQSKADLTTADVELARRLNRPEPRVAAGRVLGALASAAIDVSDGLAADLDHILESSGCGAELEAESLPRSAAFAALARDADEALTLQLHGGDDYELCLCLPQDRVAQAQDALTRLDLPLTVIGQITQQPGLRLRHAGRWRALSSRGYRHFTS